MTDPSDEELRRQLVNTADRHGAAVIQVEGDDEHAPHAFSVGAWRRFGKPELVVIGLPLEVAQSVINIYVGRVAQGERFSIGTPYEGFLEECPVVLEKVAAEHYPTYLGSAVLVYDGLDFPAHQMLVSLPDAHTFPWQPDAPEGFADFQPVLTSSGAPESWTPGRTGP